MFLKNSRYANIEQVKVNEVAAVKLRRLPVVEGDDTPITSSDRLDTIADQQYGDATKFWHIADANSALAANELLEPWLKNDPHATQISIEVPEN